MKQRTLPNHAPIVGKAVSKEQQKKSEWHPLWILLLIFLLAILLTFIFPPLFFRKKSGACDRDFSIDYRSSDHPDLLSASTIVLGEIHGRNLAAVVGCVEELAPDGDALVLLETHHAEKEQAISCDNRVGAYSAFNDLGLTCYALEGLPTGADIRAQEHRYLARFVKIFLAHLDHAKSTKLALQKMDEGLVLLKRDPTKMIRQLPEAGPRLFTACESMVARIRNKNLHEMIAELKDKMRFHLQEAEIAVTERSAIVNEEIVRAINQRRNVGFTGKIIAIVGGAHADPTENTHLSEITGNCIVLQSNAYPSAKKATGRFYTA